MNSLRIAMLLALGSASSAFAFENSTPSTPLADLRFAQEEQEIRARALKERLDTLSRQVREKATLLHSLEHGADTPRFAWQDAPRTPAHRERLERILRVAIREQLREVGRLQEQLKEAEIEREWAKLRLEGTTTPEMDLPESEQPASPTAMMAGVFRCQGLPVESAQPDTKFSLVQDFGPRRDLETGIEWRSMGWWLTGGVGPQVRACAGGTVAFSGKVHGRGRVVMIDHGGGALTLYANLSDDPGLTLSKGTKVKAGAPIGSPLEKFYFEVRRQGLAVDPRQVFASGQLASLAL